ncbi:hypothetical protein FA95DRAFT_1640103 [Auriscalpium vulgare]|uniref:Uncharacterized protein n=1 Tax=Auriscalpium vulgare TaxID=40419 RepID=A0ACB8RCP7_9AGAM|nr:hypothetical protein FA95DRAFT_1640103 [Auriscalpium vulgare]
MDNLRFVLEAPQLNQTHKKRPRLVTSCDNCRLKKIKCVQVKAQDRCEACEAANTACQFRDRERYFAERSRIVTGSSSASSSRSAANSRRSSPHGGGRADAALLMPSIPARDDSADPRAWYATGLPSPPSDQSQPSRYSSGSPSSYGNASPQSSADLWLSPEPDARPASSYGATQLPSLMPSQSGRGAMSISHPIDASSTFYRDRSLSMAQRDLQLSNLFDPRQPNRPHSSIMAHLVQVFFEHFGRLFPFLSYDDVSKRIYENTLSPLLANSMAGVACRYSQMPEIVGRGVTVVANAYCDMAKHLLGDSPHVPYIEILHAVIILAWTEYKNGRASGFSQYSEMATKMAVNMGLNDSTGANAGERTLYRSTWTSVVQLQQVSLSSASGAGAFSSH